jgi:predicted deacetylase
MHRVNISIDDVSPHPRSSIKVLDRCHEIVEAFPNAKFTLFIPTAYWRLMDEPNQKPYRLQEHPEFCDAIKKLNKENFELGFHGHFHGSSANASNNDEFKNASYEEAKETLNKMFLESIESGLGDCFRPIIRPPAWKMSKHAIKAAQDAGIIFFCLSKEGFATKTYEGAEENAAVVYQTCNPPFGPLKLTEQTEIVYHACEWDRNYLSSTMKDELISLLEKNKKDIEFCFTHDML